MTTANDISGYVAGTWDIDPVHSDIEFVLRHMGVGRSRGRFDSFSGQIVTAENPLDSTVTADIDTASINTGQADRDNHVRSGDFLDVENHPTASFRSTGIRQDGENYVIDGEFTLHGKTQPVALNAELGGITDDGQGGKLIGLSAETTVNRTDFGLDCFLPSGSSSSSFLTLEYYAYILWRDSDVTRMEIGQSHVVGRGLNSQAV